MWILRNYDRHLNIIMQSTAQKPSNSLRRAYTIQSVTLNIKY